MNPVVAQDLDDLLARPLPWRRFDGATVLVSGAGGFLAAYMVETLAALNRRGAGIRILGLVRDPAKARARLGHLLDDGLSLRAHDVSEPMPQDLPASDFVIHAASQASPRHYGVDPVGTLSANTLGTAHLLDHARRTPHSAFLFFSSSEVYGEPTRGDDPLAEADLGYLDPATVRACYGESKRMGETMCVAWARQHGVKARIVRPFHTYGPGMAVDDGRVFADFVADVVARRDLVLKSDGRARRSFCYVADATAAFFDVLLQGEPGVAYNVGNPAAECSVGELADLLVAMYPRLGLKVARADEKPPPQGYLPNTVARAVPGIARATRLGWRPTTGLRAGFGRTIRSFDASLDER